mgnify:CR=1 FL=1
MPSCGFECDRDTNAAMNDYDTADVLVGHQLCQFGDDCRWRRAYDLFADDWLDFWHGGHRSKMTVGVHWNHTELRCLVR